MSLAPVPDTAYSRSESPLTSALGTMLQPAPSQCSVKVAKKVLPLYPTAQTLFVPRATTPLRLLFVPGTFGLGTTLHVEPSQCSVKVARRLLPLFPTAQISFAELAVTLASELK